MDSPLLRAISGLCDVFFPGYFAPRPQPLAGPTESEVQTVELTLEQIAEIEAEQSLVRERQW